MAGQEPRSWLLLTYKVPPEPTRIRIYVWRQVKSLGCHSLQQAVWILPKSSETETALERLSLKIEEMGGESSVLTTVSPSPEWEARTIAGFNRARDEEYAEIVENEERFEDEIRRETRNAKFTFAEMEDMEADWEKLAKWHDRVVARDFFAASGRLEAEACLDAGRKLLREFNRLVYKHEGVEEDAADDDPVE